MRKKLLLLLGSMLLLSIVGAITIQNIGSKSSSSKANKDERINIITTFYPIYMIGLNLADQIDEVEVKSLTELQTGCLHDYQLTTEDMRLISEADVLVINGGGMESFLEDVKSNYPELTIIDASQGITMLENTMNNVSYEKAGNREADQDDGNRKDIFLDEAEHDEADRNEADQNEAGNGEEDSNEADQNEAGNREADHNEVDQNQADYKEADHDEADHNETDHNETEHNEADHKEEDADHEDHDHGINNPHVWLDPQLYVKQIENIRNGLVNYINNIEISKSKDSKLSDNKEDILSAINNNADIYIDQVRALDLEMEEHLEVIAGASDQASNYKQAVIFHDSFAYLANRARIQVVYTVPLDSDTSLSAGEIAKVIDIVNQEHIKLLFTEEQYKDSIARQIEEETEAKVQVIDTVVTGDGSKASYLKAMRNNLLVLQKAMQ